MIIEFARPHPAKNDRLVGILDTVDRIPTSDAALYCEYDNLLAEIVRGRCLCYHWT
jgi:hypothetical protein